MPLRKDIHKVMVLGSGPIVIGQAAEFDYAGTQACRALRESELPDGLPAGRAVATTAGRLPARWVVHTVGPVHSRREDRSATLASCYRESLRAAAEVGARSIAFPAISAGVYGWPMDDAARIAVQTVRETADEVAETIGTVVFVPFGEEAERAFHRWAEA